MSKLSNRSVIMTLMSFAFLATVSSMQLMPNLYVQTVNAQPILMTSPNSTSLSPLSNLSMGNQTGESLIGSFGPQSQIEAVIRELENTNATSFAARQQIETLTSNMSANVSNITEMNGAENALGGDAANDTALRSVIEQTRNTNATGFAADNVINMTSPQSPNPQDNS
jgi:hypothetical protein